MLTCKCVLSIASFNSGQIDSAWSLLAVNETSASLCATSCSCCICMSNTNDLTVQFTVDWCFKIQHLDRYRSLQAIFDEWMILHSTISNLLSWQVTCRMEHGSFACNPASYIVNGVILVIIYHALFFLPLIIFCKFPSFPVDVLPTSSSSCSMPSWVCGSVLWRFAPAERLISYLPQRLV